MNSKTPHSETAEQAKGPKRQSGKIAKRIFLGIDAHVRAYQVCRKLDQSGMQPVQSFSFESLLLFCAKQVALAEEVYAVYEAGPLGYVLYRRLREMGIQGFVCAPECLEQSKRKHNKIDCRKLASRLYSLVNGDRYAMRIVRVPSPEQESLRAQSRQYGQLLRTRKALAAQGCGLMLSQGFAIKGQWWRPEAFGQIQAVVPAWISAELEQWRTNLLCLDQQLVALKLKLAQSCPSPRPKGFGALSLSQLDREIFDYGRFSNRRQVGCFGGLCPTEHSSGDPGVQRLGSITKVGSARIRSILVEMVWRLVKFQPDYPPIVKWHARLTGTNKVLKKKAAIAVARQLFIDIWRIRTGRKTAQQLCLKLIA
jgi:transposase